MNFERKPTLMNPLVIGIMVVLLAIGIYVQNLPEETARRLTAETGPFEILTALGYGTAFLLAGLQLCRDRQPLRIATAVMTLWATLRELDFQKRFTYRSVESLGYYTNMQKATVSQKLVVLLVLTPFAIAGFYLVWQYLKRFVTAWRQSAKWLSQTLGIIILMSISSFCEKILKFGSAEEVCELGVALIVVLLMWETRAGRMPAHLFAKKDLSPTS